MALGTAPCALAANQCTRLCCTLCALVRVARAQLPAADVDEVVAEQLQTVAGELVYDFVSLTTYGRKVVCRALSLLFSALSSKGSTLASMLQRVTMPALVRSLSSADEHMVSTQPWRAVVLLRSQHCGVWPWRCDSVWRGWCSGC